MNSPYTEDNKPEYLLLFRGNDWDQGLSPEQIQQIMSQWMAWFERLGKEGTLRAGQPLMDEGMVIEGKGGQVVSDGPFPESKETIGGYFLLRVDTYEEALAAARQCPALEHGLRIEIRPVAAMCGVERRRRDLVAGATA